MQVLPFAMKTVLLLPVGRLPLTMVTLEELLDRLLKIVF